MSDARASVAAARDELARAYFRTGDYDEVDRLLAAVLADARAAHDRHAEAGAIALQGMVLHYRAIELSPEERGRTDWRPEQQLFEQALALRRELGDVEGVAESTFQLGLVHQVLRRDLDAGAQCFRAALELLDGSPDADTYLRSEVHRHVGFDALVREERHDEAVMHLRTSLELRDRLPERGHAVSGLVALALAERRAGRRDDALAHAREALEVARAENLRERHLRAAEHELRMAQEATG